MSAKTTRRKEAERRAAELEADLRHGRYVEPSRISWDDFRDRHDDERGPGLAVKSEVCLSAVFNHVERIIRPRRLADLDASQISRLQAAWRAEGRRPATIRGYLQHLRAALSWAKSVGLIHEVPEVRLPRAGRGGKLMKGRPISDQEFAVYLATVDRLRAGDAKQWRRMLECLWLSGLRLAEACELSWDASAGISVDVSRERPLLRIFGESEKGDRDRLLPITPDFAAWLLETPDAKRRGRVVPVISPRHGVPLSAAAVGVVLREIGKASGIVVDPRTGKRVSAHDLRRSFGTRWAAKVSFSDLQILMRHASIETTMKYYVGQQADEISKRLWEAASSEGRNNRERLAGVEGGGNEPPRVGQTGFIASGDASRRILSIE